MTVLKKRIKTLFIGEVIACLFLMGSLIFPFAILKRADDIFIKFHTGDLNMTNPQGGFIIENVLGNCTVTSAGGSLHFGRIQGYLKGTTRAGDIIVKEVFGEAYVSTHAGNIQIDKSHDHVFAQTNLGEIIIQSAKSAEVKSINGGDAKIMNVSGYSKVAARGNILLITKNEFSGDTLCDLSTTNGDITIYLPEDFGADIEINPPITMDVWRETRIESDFSFIDFRHKYEKNQILKISTSINGGGVKINLYVEKGNVSLLKIRGRQP